MDAFNKFLDEMKNLDRAVLQVDSELVGAADIHQDLFTLAAYKHELETLPNAFAELVAEKAKADERRARRAEGARKAKHPITMIEAALKKLDESLRHNLASLTEAAEASPSDIAQAFGAALPGTRRERVEQIRREIAEVEATLAEPKAVHKKAAALYKGEVTKSKNLAIKLAEIGRQIGQNRDKLSEMAKLAKKTSTHLRNRQANRDRKAAERLPKEEPAVEMPAAEAATAPSDEQIRDWAQLMGFGDIRGADDLAAARDLHLQTAY